MNAGHDPQNGQYPWSHAIGVGRVFAGSGRTLPTLFRDGSRWYASGALPSSPISHTQIGREAHVEGARPDRLLISRQRNAEQRIRVYTLEQRSRRGCAARSRPRRPRPAPCRAAAGCPSARAESATTSFRSAGRPRRHFSTDRRAVESGPAAASSSAAAASIISRSRRC